MSKLARDASASEASWWGSWRNSHFVCRRLCSCHQRLSLRFPTASLVPPTPTRKLRLLIFTYPRILLGNFCHHHIHRILRYEELCLQRKEHCISNNINFLRDFIKNVVFTSRPSHHTLRSHLNTGQSVQWMLSTRNDWVD